MDYLADDAGVVYDASLGYSASAFKTPDGRLVAVIVNTGAARNFTVTAPLRLRADVWQSTAEESMAQISNGTLLPRFAVPQNSITTVVLY